MEPMDFDAAFHALTENDPFPWQQRLYKKFVEGDFPQACILPTGLGKTSVLAIWLLALAQASDKVPRRLVYVVNRRTVVDQSTDEAVKLRKNLSKVTAVRDALTKLCAVETELPLAISTLRGEFADNGEWRNDPARPAIIAGTVDMIGSRLLFSGYNAGFKTRPLHAGLLGCGALLIHDEAHLEPAFQCTLDAIVAEQQKREPGSLRVMELTATTRKEGVTPFELDDEDRANEVVKARIGAAKAITLHQAEQKGTTELLTDLALGHKDSKKAILVFARTVDAVEKIASKLGKKAKTLTGTMRGYERDALTDDPIFKRFLPKAEAGVETVYLVCTSAGEVGVNISADHLVCDLSTFESMAQRFGRVNRFGSATDTKIDIVHPETFDDEESYEQRRRRTRELLRELNGDGSPDRLGKLDLTRRVQAFAPEPVIPVTSDILFDAWSMTTIRDALPGRPPVADWLHGVSEWEPPRTQVAWREEVERFTPEILERYPPKDLLEDYPLKPHELLSDRFDRVFKHLEKLAGRDGELPVWVIDEDEVVYPMKLAALASAGKDRLKNVTVLLPPKAGGLSEAGMLDSASRVASDVADDWGKPRLRRRTWNGETDDSFRLIRAFFPDEGKESKEGEEPKEPRVWRWYVAPADAEDENGSRVSRRKAQVLGSHNARVGEFAEQIAKTLGLSESLKRVARLAGWGHDLGKDRELWQRSIGNPVPMWPLAKSDDAVKGPRWRTGYRHEFGSLTDVRTMSEFDDLSHDERELVLHLLAAHHGRGRPHFPGPEAFDLIGGEAAARALAVEVPKRFARLQRRYGRWRLALLESILRAADYLASEESQK